MDRNRLADHVHALTQAEAKRLFGRVFGDVDGQKALLYILIKIGGLCALRGNAANDLRGMLDGRREAALEIMNLAGFSPFDLAARLLDVKPLTSKDLDDENLPVQDAAAQRGRDRGDLIPASALAADAPGGDPAGDGPGTGDDEPAGD